MIKSFLKKSYFIFFSIYKHFKYPNCEIYTNFIMPNVKLGKGVVVRNNVIIGKNVNIDSYTFINEYTRIDSNTLQIGKYCSISHNVKIGLGSHPVNFFSTSPVFYEPYRGYVKEQLFDEFEDKGYTNIGNDVLIGANAIILAGVKIGDGAVIGAGSVVTKDVPPYAIVAGNPAKVIKYRFSKEQIEKLLEIKWWNMEIDNILKFSKYFSNINLFIDNFKENENV